MYSNVFGKRRFLSAFICLVFTVITQASDQVNYDTAWTFIYDGGKTIDDWIIEDDFSGLQILPDGGCVGVGLTRDSSGTGCILLMRLSKDGKAIWKKTFEGAVGRSIAIAQNGDFLIGGDKGAPFVLRTDSLGNIKWSTWYYDSIKDKDFLSRSATINSIIETSSGSIVCAAGDPYLDINSSTLDNYAAFLEFDSLGKKKRSREWDNQLGSAIAPFHIQETNTGGFLMSGYESVFGLDNTGMVKWKSSYGFMLEGVGSETNRVSRAKQLRDGTAMVAGQAYESKCWIKYEKLYYDAWWSPIDIGSGGETAWDTAGWQGGNDNIYDFTQLSDGKLVFVGRRYNVTDSGGIWTFVTDSTGKTILWEKQTKIIYNTDNGKSLTPLSICPTPDGGFTVAGRTWGSAENGGNNGFVAHFIPVAIAKVSQNRQTEICKQPVQCQTAGSKVIFTITEPSLQLSKMSIYNASGKLVAKMSGRTGSGDYIWDCSHVNKGIYFYRIQTGVQKVNGNIVLN